MRTHIAPFLIDGSLSAPDARSPALPGYDGWRDGNVDWQKLNRRTTVRIVLGALACWGLIFGFAAFLWWAL